MATVTGVTAARAKSIEDRLIQSASRQGTSLVLTTVGGQVINVANAFPAIYESHPVGSIYLSVDSRNPSAYMGGGKWARWGVGRVPVSVNENDGNFNAVEKLGGVPDVTLDITQIPSHDHGALTGNQDRDHTHTGWANANGQHSHTQWISAHRTGIQGGGGLSVADNSYTTSTTWDAGSHDHTVGTYGASHGHYHGIAPQGGGGSHTNLQPYITCYMWKRMPDNWNP